MGEICEECKLRALVLIDMLSFLCPLLIKVGHNYGSIMNDGFSNAVHFNEGNENSKVKMKEK